MSFWGDMHSDLGFFPTLFNILQLQLQCEYYAYDGVDCPLVNNEVTLFP